MAPINFKVVPRELGPDEVQVVDVSKSGYTVVKVDDRDVEPAKVLSVRYDHSMRCVGIETEHQVLHPSQSYTVEFTPAPVVSHVRFHWERKFNWELPESLKE